jgi:alpha-glucosidase
VAAEPWWRSAVVYQIYPRSFADSDGDGIGDLEGIRRHLDHLTWLGVDTLWLSPIYRSPMEDFGYDVSDHCDIDPSFGTLEDFDRLLADAHGRGLRVLLDWVPNHTSDRHPWFVESRAGTGSRRRSWYVWRDGRDDGPPNNWRAAFTGEVRWERDPATGESRRVRVPAEGADGGFRSAWTLDDATGQWYLHLFLPSQPDLNWREPAVVEAQHDVLRFWLDRGVDGFRADVIHCIGKHPDLPDDRSDLAEIPKSATNDDPSTHELLRGIRSLLDGYPGERMIVGEVYLLDTARVATYYGRGDELHLAFNFPPLFTRWQAQAWRQRVDEVVQHFGPVAGWPTWVLSNHDNPRHRTRYGSEPRARAAALLLLALRGTPFLYAGEELGLEDAEIPAERAVDPGGRDGCRAPLPWTAEAPHGWGGTPWLPWPPDPGRRSVEAERDDPGSMLHLYRRLLTARQASAALTLGTLEPLSAPDDRHVLAWGRHHEGDRRVAAVNFTGEARPLPVEGDWTVEVASDGVGEGRRWASTLGPDQAVLLRPG